MSDSDPAFDYDDAFSDLDPFQLDAMPSMGNVFGGQTDTDPAAMQPRQAEVPALPAPGMGSGPDGLGVTVTDPMPGDSGPGDAVVIPRGDAPPMPPDGYPGMEGSVGWEPQDTSPNAALVSGGITALVAAGAVAGGAALGKGWGAVAGGLLVGSVANGYRAQKNMASANPDQKHEAVVSGVFSLLGAGLGIYAAYQAFQLQDDSGD